MRRLACTCSTTAAKPLDRVRVAGGFVLDRVLLDGWPLRTVVETVASRRHRRAVYFLGGGGVGAGADGACGVTLGGGCVATLGAGCAFGYPVASAGERSSVGGDMERVWRRVGSWGSRGKT